MADAPPKPANSILIINPNTSHSMTDALRPLVASLQLATVRPPVTLFALHFALPSPPYNVYPSPRHYTAAISRAPLTANPQTTAFFTAPTGVPSINNEADAALSTHICLPHLLPLLDQHDAFLVACYSAHPLIPALRSALSSASHSPTEKQQHKPVTGIFEASVSTCLTLLSPSQTFGIVSTGSQWESILQHAVCSLLGCDSSRFAGTETTGLSASELHSAPRELVDERIRDATKRLLDRAVGAICLGCAGMSGLEGVVKGVIREVSGEKGVRVVDGVVAGVWMLEGGCRGVGL